MNNSSDLSRLSLVEKVGQCFMIGFKGLQVPSETQEFIQSHHIGFTILFTRNIQTIPQVKTLTQSIRKMGKHPVFIYTDQEGGTIVRFNEMAATVCSPMGIAATCSLENAETAGRLIGEDMRCCGIDGVFAPVLDVNIEEDNPVIGIRSFSDQPQIVTDYAERFWKGLNTSKVLACGKHYPGHGAAAADSHLEIPIIPMSYEYFRYYCYEPFEALARRGIDSIMTAHVKFPDIAPEISTFSPYLIKGLLRNSANYNGVIFSDCMEMKAVKDHFKPGEIVLNAFTAGVDVMIVSHSLDFQKEMVDAMHHYVKRGTITENRLNESVKRIFALKNKFKALENYNTNTNNPNEEQKLSPESSDLRKKIDEERRIAEQSVTLLRDNNRVIPTDKNSRTLILEWSRRITGPSVAENEGPSMIESISGQIMLNRDYRILTPDTSLPSHIETLIHQNNYERIIACIYSRTGAADRFQSQAVNQLLKIRKDTIIVSLENPYEVKKFPSVNTYLVTYGFRKVQIEALFRIITGAIAPSGKLPVNIKNIFPIRWPS